MTRARDAATAPAYPERSRPLLCPTPTETSQVNFKGEVKGHPTCLQRGQRSILERARTFEYVILRNAAARHMQPRTRLCAAAKCGCFPFNLEDSAHEQAVVPHVISSENHCAEE